MNIGKMINQRRIELNMTLEEVGNIVGVSKSTVKKWEDGYIANMRRDKIALLAKALKINPIALVNTDETNNDFVLETIKCSSDPLKNSLLYNYETLNTTGKQKLVGYSEDLVNCGNYIKTDKIQTLMIARSDDPNNTVRVSDDIPDLSQFPEDDSNL